MANETNDQGTTLQTCGGISPFGNLTWFALKRAPPREMTTPQPSSGRDNMLILSAVIGAQVFHASFLGVFPNPPFKITVNQLYGALSRCATKIAPNAFLRSDQLLNPLPPTLPSNYSSLNLVTARPAQQLFGEVLFHKEVDKPELEPAAYRSLNWQPRQMTVLLCVWLLAEVRLEPSGFWRTEAIEWGRGKVPLCRLTLRQCCTLPQRCHTAAVSHAAMSLYTPQILGIGKTGRFNSTAFLDNGSEGRLA
ncbi:hypothetical protein C8R45DRAFT_939299 [Mycena sanguinolenta]|nr:hypothetical protein C8R45DRAFT_939299 [Mycena sanguinolenta]